MSLLHHPDVSLLFSLPFSLILEWFLFHVALNVGAFLVPKQRVNDIQSHCVIKPTSLK